MGHSLNEDLGERERERERERENEMNGNKRNLDEKGNDINVVNIIIFFFQFTVFFILVLFPLDFLLAPLISITKYMHVLFYWERIFII
jgi:Flp pilus assembly protein TadB